MKIQIPNILTIGRIIIVPIFVLTFFLPGYFGDLIPFFLFALALLFILFLLSKISFPAPKQEIKKNITNEIIKLK